MQTMKLSVTWEETDATMKEKHAKYGPSYRVYVAMNAARIFEDLGGVGYEFQDGDSQALLEGDTWHFTAHMTIKKKPAPAQSEGEFLKFLKSKFAPTAIDTATIDFLERREREANFFRDILPPTTISLESPPEPGLEFIGNYPQEGEERFNTRVGQVEVYRNGKWEKGRDL